MSGGLSRLLDKARGWLTTAPAQPDEVLAVHQDRFNRALFEEVLADAPALRGMIRDLNQTHSFTDSLVSDTFAQFFQASPRLRDAGEMRPSHLVNHGVARDVANCPETPAMRLLSQHDKYGAAIATLSVGRKVVEYLERHEEVREAADAAEQAQQQAQQAQQDLQEALEQAQQAQDALDQAPAGDDAPEGDLGGDTEAGGGDQAAADGAGKALQSALGKAQRAAEAAQARAEAAQQAAGQMQQALRSPVRAGVQEAAEQLDEEAELFRGWGVEDGVVQRMSFAERQRLAARLRSHRLGKFVKELGRWRLMAAAQRAKKVVRGRDEVYGTTLGGHLPDVLAGEFVSLGIPALRTDFMVRLSERRLISKRFRGVEKTGQGAIVAVVDTSSSMTSTDAHGVSRECWSKGLLLAMLEQARVQQRDFVCILFANATSQRTFIVKRGEATIEQVLEMTSVFLGGGTDFAAPLDLAMSIIEKDFDSDGRAKADIVLITDDECAVTPAWMRGYQTRKERLSFRTFGIAVGMQKPGSTLAALSDNVRAVQEFIDPSVAADLIRTI